MQTLEALPMFKVKKLFPQAFRQSSFHSLLHTSPNKKKDSYNVDEYKNFMNQGYGQRCYHS